MLLEKIVCCVCLCSRKLTNDLLQVSGYKLMHQTCNLKRHSCSILNLLPVSLPTVCSSMFVRIQPHKMSTHFHIFSRAERCYCVKKSHFGSHCAIVTLLPLKWNAICFSPLIFLPLFLSRSINNRV